METDHACGLGMQSLLHMPLSDCQEKAKALSINNEHVVTFRTQSGWQGICEGVLQMLWKRGFIGAMKLKNYQIKAIDGDGKVIPELSLEHIIENYHDFINVKSHFEYDCQQLGARALQ